MHLPDLTCLCVHRTVPREEEAIQLDGLNAAQIKEIRDKSEKHVFQAEVSRMMKLIINSLYKNKEVSRNKWDLDVLYHQFCKLILVDLLVSERC